MREDYAEYVLGAIAGETGVTVEALRGRSRRQPIAEARLLAYYCLRREHSALTEIAALFGRDHSTVSTGLRSMRRRITLDPWYAEVVASVLPFHDWMRGAPLPQRRRQLAPDGCPDLRARLDALELRWQELAAIVRRLEVVA